MKKKIVAMLVLFACASLLFADLPPALRGLFPPEAAAQLEGKGEVTAVFKENGTLAFLPRLAAAAPLAAKVAAIKPMFGVEVCLLHKPGPKKADTREGLLGLYNNLLKVSSLKGILYYSVTRHTMREFFTESYRIDGPETKVKLADLTVADPAPAATSIFTFQNDSSFGENIYRIDYKVEAGSILMMMENVTKIWYGIFPLVDPGNFAYLILVYPAGDYLVFYSVVCVKGANPFGLLESRTESFYNRIKALDEWFRGQSGVF
jgi:hypothetical protein